MPTKVNSPTNKNLALSSMLTEEQNPPTAAAAISTARSPTLKLSSKSMSMDVVQKCKVKYLQAQAEYPMSTLSPRQFTLKRQKRVGADNRSRKNPQTSGMRKSKSLDAEHNYSLTSIQSPLWVTLTNARTIEELSREQI